MLIVSHVLENIIPIKIRYAADLLVASPFLLAIKGNFFNLQGAYGAPLVAGSILILLLILHLPVIYRPLQRMVRRNNAER